VFWYDGQLFDDSPSNTGADDIPNGPLSHPPFDTAGLRFGASVFTTLRVYGQRLDHPMTQWQAHCDRLKNSLTYFTWSEPDWSSIYVGCQLLKDHYPVLRITVFPDGKVWISGRSLPPNLDRQQQKGISAWLAPADYARSFPSHKTGNYLACWLARQAAQRHGAQEAILTNVNGDWLETATGNLWGWADGQWWSPLSQQIGRQCLPGIMRQRILYLLTEFDQPVNSQHWDKSTWSRFEAIAYSNCVVQLLPIHTILLGRTTLEYNPQHASLKALQQRLTTSAEHTGDS